jgi:hypothetical protein
MYCRVLVTIRQVLNWMVGFIATAVHIKSSFYSLMPFLLSLLNHSTAVTRNSIMFPSDGLGADTTDKIVSIVINQQCLDCCLRIRWPQNLFTESLPGNERLPWLRYSGFQASFHSTLPNTLVQIVTFYICIQELPVSNHGLDTDSPDWDFSRFPSVTSRICRDSTLKSGQIRFSNIRYWECCSV